MRPVTHSVPFLPKGALSSCATSFSSRAQASGTRVNDTTSEPTSAAQMVQVLRPLVAQYGQLVSLPGTNTIIISDRANNVARIMKIIGRVDQAGDANIGGGQHIDARGGGPEGG